jgi:hypothetical protein
MKRLSELSRAGIGRAHARDGSSQRTNDKSLPSYPNGLNMHIHEMATSVLLVIVCGEQTEHLMLENDTRRSMTIKLVSILSPGDADREDAEG